VITYPSQAAQGLETPSPLGVRDLTVVYREKPALWDVDLEIPAGQLCAIVGPNGAGKSTLIKAVLGLVPTASGQVRFFGQSLAQARKRIGYVPQRGSVDWDFPTSVLDVVMMGLYGKLGWFRRPGPREREVARWSRSRCSSTHTGKSHSYPAASSNGYSWPGLWPKTLTSTLWMSPLQA